MRQIRILVEYDGTNYSGWQLQPNGTTIQEVLEKALSTIAGGHVRVTSSGRTDAGVHARGMVATFLTERDLPLRAFRDGANALLPPDVAVKSADEVPLSFNPRKDALRKRYRYTINTGGTRSPLSRLYSWQIRRPLDLDAMRTGGAHLVGEHDFAAFRGYNCAAKTTIRTIYSVELTRDGDFILIDVTGTGFLKNMVRIIAGTLVEVGLGKLRPEDVPAILAGGRRPDAGATAPPQGLCLMEVEYPL